MPLSVQQNAQPLNCVVTMKFAPVNSQPTICAKLPGAAPTFGTSVQGTPGTLTAEKIWAWP